MTALSGMVKVETWMITYAVTDMAPYSFLFDDEILPSLIFFSLCSLGSSFIFWGGRGVGVGGQGSAEPRGWTFQWDGRAPGLLHFSTVKKTWWT